MSIPVPSRDDSLLGVAEAPWPLDDRDLVSLGPDVNIVLVV